MYKLKLAQLSVSSLQQGLADRVGVAATQLQFRYRDADGDDISIMNDSDLKSAANECPASLRLTCLVKKSVLDTEERAGAAGLHALSLQPETRFHEHMSPHFPINHL